MYSRGSFSHLFFFFSLSLSQPWSLQHPYSQLRLSSLLSPVMYCSCFPSSHTLPTLVLFQRRAPLAVTIFAGYPSYSRSRKWALGEDKREREREKRTLSSRGGCQEAVVRTRSEIETLPACAREYVYMESSLRRTCTKIASLAGRVARLVQYLSYCKFDVSLIIRGKRKQRDGG